MIQLHTATPSDAPALSHIYTASWKAAYPQLVPAHYLARLPEGSWIPALTGWLETGRLDGLVATKAGQPVGGILYGRCRDEDRPLGGEVVALYVHPDHWRQGIGSLLLSKAMDDLLPVYGSVSLWMFAGHTDGDAFYRHHGFAPDGAATRYLLGGEPMTELRYVRFP